MRDWEWEHVIHAYVKLISYISQLWLSAARSLLLYPQGIKMPVAPETIQSESRTSVLSHQCSRTIVLGSAAAGKEEGETCTTNRLSS